MHGYSPVGCRHRSLLRRRPVLRDDIGRARGPRAGRGPTRCGSTVLTINTTGGDSGQPAHLHIDDQTEWLEADGLGGFASGTTAGVRTRRYHALLLTAMTPPTGRV